MCERGRCGDCRLRQPGVAGSGLRYVKTESAVIDELRELCHSPGYAHAIAVYWMRGNMLRSSDGQATAEGLAGTSTGLTRREIDILVGLTVQGDLDLALPGPSVTLQRMQATDRLMRELHDVIGDPIGRFLASGAMDFGEALREPIIYGPESAYETQYLDFAIDRYSEDDLWLRSSRGFGIDDAVSAAKVMIAIRGRAMEEVLRGARTISPGRNDLLAAFAVGVDDVAAECALDTKIVGAVMEAFALRGGNAEFATPSDFNAVVATPLIGLGAGRYLLFQNYTLAEAIYATPSYWMGEDRGYRDAHGDHRGRFTERFCKERLSAVFGRERVFSNVELLAGKRVLGEIDVLVLYGNRAIVVQAKSKRLTVQARKGDLQKARADFAKAVQSANDQGFSCAEHLLQPDCVLALEDGIRLTVGSDLKEVYVVCAVADAYPALTFQASHFLEYKTTERIQPPLVADVFLIDVVAEMLATPLRFLSYLNRRVNYHKKIVAPDELAVLAVHLRENLWVEKDTDMLAILAQGTWDLDVAMMVRRAGMSGKATPDGSLTRLGHTVVGGIVEQIEAKPDRAAIELGLMLLKLGEGLIEQIDAAVDEWRRQRDRNRMHGLSLSIRGADAGLTILANRLGQAKAEKHLAGTCVVRKYESRVTTWYGMVLDGSDCRTLRHAVVISYGWEPDEEVANAMGRFPARGNGWRE